MAPPDLPRDTPIFDIAHPAKIVIRPTFRNNPNSAFFDRLDCRIGQGLNLDEPLGREVRLDYCLAAIAFSERHLVIFNLEQCATFAKECFHLGSGLCDCETTKGFDDFTVDRSII